MGLEVLSTVFHMMRLKKVKINQTPAFSVILCCPIATCWAVLQQMWFLYLCLPGLVLHHQEEGKAEPCTGPASLTLAADSAAACTYGRFRLLQPCSSHRCLQPKMSPHYCREETNGFLPIRDLPKSPGEGELPIQFPHPWCVPQHSLSPCAAFCQRDKLSITNLKSKGLQNPNLWALTCYHRQKSYTPNLAWYTTAKHGMLKITGGYRTVRIWSEMECYANLGVTKK